MTEKPDPMELVRDLEKFATNPSERLLAKELGSLLFDHSTLKVENAKLKQDLHHYMLAANAEAQLVDMLQKENSTLVRQNGIWQEENASLDRIASDLQDTCDKQAKKLAESEALLKQALEALETCDAAHPSDGGRQWYDDKAVEAAITAIKERLNLTKGS
jgi:DNA repair exonuclease SbcCD ATPase subunit